MGASETTCPTRWSESLHADLLAIYKDYSAISKFVVALAEQRSGEVWDLVRSIWTTSKFLQVLAGLIAHIIMFGRCC